MKVKISYSFIVDTKDVPAGENIEELLVGKQLDVEQKVDMLWLLADSAYPTSPIREVNGEFADSMEISVEELKGPIMKAIVICDCGELFDGNSMEEAQQTLLGHVNSKIHDSSSQHGLKYAYQEVRSGRSTHTDKA